MLLRQPSFRDSVTAYFREWRYRGHAVIGCFIAMYLGWLGLAGGLSSADGRRDSVAATLVALALVLAIFMLNDAADRDIDAVVHAERPIPRGLADWRHIQALSLGLLAAALVGAALIKLRFLIAVAGLEALTLLYYSYFKRRAPLPCSSELMAPLISAAFPVTAFAVVPVPRLDLLLAIAGFIYLADLAQDMLGGIHDEAGDRRFGVRTFAVSLGAEAARWLSAAAFLLSVVAAAVLDRMVPLGWIYRTALLALTALMLVHYARLLRADALALPRLAGRANHLGGIFYFALSASLFPDYLLRTFID